jgi:hypothetical protein
MKHLQEFSYRELVANGSGVMYWDWINGQKKRLRVVGSDGKFVHLVTEDNEVRSYPNPEWYRYFVQGEKEKKAQEKTRKAAESRRLDRVDKKAVKKMAEDYKGDLKKDLLQPFLPDGRPNSEFEKHYGKPKNAVPTDKSQKL